MPIGTDSLPWSPERHEALSAELLQVLSTMFDLEYPLTGGSLGWAMERRLERLLHLSSPCWGMKGSINEIAEEGSRDLRFRYRPHLMPEMSDTLRLAHQLQYDLLPTELPRRAPLRISAMLESYCHLSGDVLGWRVKDDHFYLWIADISGHGVRAGLGAAVFYLLAKDLDRPETPREAVETLSARFLEARNPADQAALYATAFYARLDLEGSGTYASCGHPPMLLQRHGGAIERLPATGLPLGMFPFTRAENRPLEMDAGDLLVLYTDGIIEAVDSDGEELGLDWLRDVVASSGGSVGRAMRSIDDEITERTDRSAIEDDLTYLVAARR